MKKIIFLAVTSLLMSVPAFAQDELANDDISTMNQNMDPSLVRPGRPGPGRPGPGRPPGPPGPGRPDRPGPGWPDQPGRPDRGGYCTVTFKSCRLEVGGICVSWKSRQFNVSRWDARDGCWIAERRYGHIRSCRVHCNR